MFLAHKIHYLLINLKRNLLEKNKTISKLWFGVLYQSSNLEINVIKSGVQRFLSGWVLKN